MLKNRQEREEFINKMEADKRRDLGSIKLGNMSNIYSNNNNINITTSNNVNNITVSNINVTKNA